MKIKRENKHISLKDKALIDFYKVDGVINGDLNYDDTENSYRQLSIDRTDTKDLKKMNAAEKHMVILKNKKTRMKKPPEIIANFKEDLIENNSNYKNKLDKEHDMRKVAYGQMSKKSYAKKWGK